MVPHPTPLLARLTLLALLAGAVVFGSSSAEADANIKRTARGKTIRWDRAILHVCLSDAARALPRIDEHLDAAMDVWNDTGVTPFFDRGGRSCEVEIDYGRGTVATTPLPLATSTLTYYRSTGEASLAEIVFDKRYAGQLGDAALDSRAYDIRGILVHELGHALGLDEDVLPGTAMTTTTGRGETIKRALAAADQRAIRRLYGPGAEATVAAARPTAE